MSEFGNCIMQLLATIIFIAVIQPWILVGIAPLGIVYYFLQKYYRCGTLCQHAPGLLLVCTLSILLRCALCGYCLLPAVLPWAWF